jgi:hypothetical protein
VGTGPQLAPAWAAANTPPPLAETPPLLQTKKRRRKRRRILTVLATSQERECPAVAATARIPNLETAAFP